MNKKRLKNYVGRVCKISTKELGEKIVTITVGLIEEIDDNDGFLIIDGENGLVCLNINSIISIEHASALETLRYKKKKPKF